MSINEYSKLTLPTVLSYNFMIDNFCNKLSVVIDHLAPAKSKQVSDPEKTSWRNTVTRLKKTIRPRAEPNWIARNLQVDFKIYETALFDYNQEMKYLRQSYTVQA